MTNHYKPQYSKKPRRLKLKGFGYLGHYTFVVLLFFPFLIAVFNYILYYFGIYEGVRPIHELFELTAIFVLSAFILFIIQFKRLAFEYVETSLTTEHIINMCTKYAEVNKLEIKYIGQNEFVARSNRSSLLDWGKWGEMLTVIVQDQKVYINCICDPYQRPNIVSMGKTKAYKEALKETLKRANPH